MFMLDVCYCLPFPLTHNSNFCWLCYNVFNNGASMSDDGSSYNQGVRR